MDLSKTKCFQAVQVSDRRNPKLTPSLIPPAQVIFVKPAV